MDVERCDCKAGAVEYQKKLLAESSADDTIGPLYGSGAFWRWLDNLAVYSNLALEKLVGYVRQAVEAGDDTGRNRLVEVIIWRTQAMNQTWAYFALRHSPIRVQDLDGQAWDLYADLCELLVRSLINPQKIFWEENFLHCLRFERQHAYRAFMIREGYWQHSPAWRCKRVPRVLLASLDQPCQSEASSEPLEEWYLEDDQARRELLQVEQTELLYRILRYPVKLRSVLLLIFWEGRTEKEAASILGVTDRTIRNRLREALQLLRSEMRQSGEETGYIAETAAPYLLGKTSGMLSWRFRGLIEESCLLNEGQRAAWGEVLLADGLSLK